MVLIDSDIFILDLFYPKDPRAKINSAFLELDLAGRATTLFNLLEICGIASFNKSTAQVKRLFREFHQTYRLDILYPDLGWPSAEEFLEQLATRTFSRILLRMNFNDALILATAESYGVSTLATWNVKHFEDRTAIKVQTPAEFLETLSPTP